VYKCVVVEVYLYVYLHIAYYTYMIEVYSCLMVYVHVNSRRNHQKSTRVATELQSDFFYQIKGQDVCHINDPWKHAPSICKGLQTQNSNSTTRLVTYNWQILIFGVKAKTCSWPWAFHRLPVPSFPTYLIISYQSCRLIEIRRFAHGLHGKAHEGKHLAMWALMLPSQAMTTIKRRFLES